MTNIKATKRALGSSVLALFLCFAMLLGTTFAWFTDSVTSANNIITAGNLDVELEYWKDGKWNDVKGASDILTNELWEPGTTQVAYLRVKNAGSLAFKYQLGINIVSETFGTNKAKQPIILSDYIQFGVVEGVNGESNAYATREDAVNAIGTNAKKISAGYTKAASMESDDQLYLALVVWMPETVGNEANAIDENSRPKIELGINVVATQYNSESDSFGNDYDADLDPNTSYVSDAAGLQEALNNGGNIVLQNDIKISESNFTQGDPNSPVVSIPVGLLINSGKSTIIDFNGNTISAEETGGQTALIHILNTDVTITGNGNFVQSGTDDDYVIWAKGDSTVEIIGGNFVTEDPDNILLYASNDGDNKAEIEIYGGNFKSAATNDPQRFANVRNFHLGKITFYGGTFNFNPDWTVLGQTSGDARDDAQDITIAEDYQTVDNGDGTYTVIPDKYSIVEGYPNLYTDGANGYYVYNAQGLKSLHEWINMWNSFGTTLNIMADINASGYTWASKSLSPNGDETPGFTFNGNGHTISNLTIENGLFSLAANGTTATEPTTFKDITFDNVTVTGDYHVGVVWGQVAGDLVLNNVHVKNSNITGNYNVGGLVGSTGEFAIDASVKYVDCSVTNTNITANGAAGGDPTGASAFIGRALGKTSLVFEGNNVAENITYVNKNELVGGGIYGYTTWANGGFTGTGVCDSFTDWDGLAVVTNNVELIDAIEKGENTLYLTNGEYDLNGNQKDGLTLIGLGDDVKMANTTTYASGKATGAIWQAITLKNVTITNTVYTMADGGKSKFENVKFAAGFRQGYGTAVEFNNCTFGSNSEGYALHFQTDSASEGGMITLNGCKFDGGKVHLGGKRAYAFTGCDFAQGTDFQVWSNITLEKCTVNGVAVTYENIKTFFPKLDVEKVTIN